MTRQNRPWVAAVAGHGCQASLQRDSSRYVKCGLHFIEAVTQDFKRQTHEATGLGHTDLKPEVSVRKPGRGGRLRRRSSPSKGRHPVSNRESTRSTISNDGRSQRENVETQRSAWSRNLSGDSTLVVKTQHMASGALGSTPITRGPGPAGGPSGAAVKPNPLSPTRACHNPNKRGMEHDSARSRKWSL